MQIHRTPHQRFFTTLGNDVLRDSRLSFCARGILAYLLSLPDGQPGDIRTLAGRTPEGRERIASGLRELERVGYLRRSCRHTEAGRIYMHVEVFDRLGDASAPVTPAAGLPGSGGPESVPDGVQPDKELVEEKPSLPRPRRVPAVEDAGPGREGIAITGSEFEGSAVDGGAVDGSAVDGSAVDSGDADESTVEDGQIEETVKSAAVLARVSRAEPRLALGQFETLALAPLVTEWRRRGATDRHIIGTLTAGLPGAVYSPAALVRDRLRRKMPAERVEIRARAECAGCGAPLAVAGICRHCRQPGAVPPAYQCETVATRARGVALARAALRDLPGGSAAFNVPA
jgi:hypothetical protein